jgi:hypothetical protein
MAEAPDGLSQRATIPLPEAADLAIAGATMCCHRLRCWSKAI